MAEQDPTTEMRLWRTGRATNVMYHQRVTPITKPFLLLVKVLLNLGPLMVTTPAPPETTVGYLMESLDLSQLICLDEMDTCPTLNTEDDPCSNFLESTFANSFMDDPTHWSTLTQDVHVAHLACLSNETMSGDELPKLDVCFCVDLIIAAHATMQVKLVWVTSLSGCTSSSIDDMLQCQKDVLTSCETVLGCMKCSLRSDYVVLVISMCREMVDGVRALMVITSKEHRNSRRLHLSSDTSSQAKLEAGGWRLEDDDEIEIIRHLVQLRIKKLKNLIDQLEHTVLANHVSYVWVVSNLRDRLSDI